MHIQAKPGANMRNSGISIVRGWCCFWIAEAEEWFLVSEFPHGGGSAVWVFDCDLVTEQQEDRD